MGKNVNFHLSELGVSALQS